MAKSEIGDSKPMRSAEEVDKDAFEDATPLKANVLHMPAKLKTDEQSPGRVALDVASRTPR